MGEVVGEVAQDRHLCGGLRLDRCVLAGQSPIFDDPEADEFRPSIVEHLLQLRLDLGGETDWRSSSARSTVPGVRRAGSCNQGNSEPDHGNCGQPSGSGHLRPHSGQVAIRLTRHRLKHAETNTIANTGGQPDPLTGQQPIRHLPPDTDLLCSCRLRSTGAWPAEPFPRALQCVPWG